MNKTLKRQVFRHTALYAAILMFSHTGGRGGQAQAQTYKYAIVMNAQNQPEVKSNVPYSIKDKDRKRVFDYTSQKSSLGGTNNFISFNNNDEVVARKTVLPFWHSHLPAALRQVSGFDADALKERANAVDWIRTTRPGWQATPTPTSYAETQSNAPTCL
ncbi:hypothetical protein [Neisseria gonorrhoeae]|uniref:hypothetical protein n=1 Tax=Neisseria gonorrhoeae TaxID=485 RepID=UPI001E29F6EC|nr:hypothetical protein [Neisseria gonorrhoeae]MCC9030354.1 hypothetical protein [Neisseria gonorrhoeae]